MATTADPAPAHTPRGHLVAPPRPPGALRGVRAHHPGRAAGADPPAPMMPRKALARFQEFDEQWGQRYPAITRMWRSAWTEFVPVLDYDVEVRRVICTTNAIESLNARYRRAIRARGHCPTEQAALKCLYLATRSPDPTGRGRARWVMRWKPALNAFAVTFEGRIDPTTTN